MVDSYYFEIYFRVSQHLGCRISEVIRNKFNPDYRVLIHKYHMQVQAEIEQAEKIKEESRKYKH